MEKICCVIVTYNCDDGFYKGFNAIKSQVNKVVIVDNGSNTNTIEMLNEIKIKNDVEIIFNDKNLGIANALNKGVYWAKTNGYKWVLTLDHDSEASEGMVEKMIKAYRSLDENEQKITMSLFANYVNREFESNIEEMLSMDISIREVKWGITSGNLMKTELFDLIGSFMEELFIDYVDVEYCFRMVEKGYKMLSVDNAILFHNLGEMERRKTIFGTRTLTNHSAVRKYYITRNRLYVWNKYKTLMADFNKRDKSVFLRETCKIALYEKNKIEKIKMIARGFIDYNKNIFGEINYKK